jgi:hypothetical protein
MYCVPGCTWYMCTHVVYMHVCMRVTREVKNTLFPVFKTFKISKKVKKKVKNRSPTEVFHTQLHPPASSCFFSAFNARTTFSGGLEYTPNNMPATTIHIPTHPYAIGRPFPSP